VIRVMSSSLFLGEGCDKTLEESGFSNRQRASFRACSALRFFS